MSIADQVKVKELEQRVVTLEQRLAFIEDAYQAVIDNLAKQPEVERKYDKAFAQEKRKGG
jgi:uncharacterized coiled-coil protein SlyX